MDYLVLCKSLGLPLVFLNSFESQYSVTSSSNIKKSRRFFLSKLFRLPLIVFFYLGIGRVFGIVVKLKNDATAHQKLQKVDSVYLDIAFSVGETFDQPSKSLRFHLKM